MSILSLRFYLDYLILVVLLWPYPRTKAIIEATYFPNIHTNLSYCLSLPFPFDHELNCSAPVTSLQSNPSMIYDDQCLSRSILPFIAHPIHILSCFHCCIQFWAKFSGIPLKDLHNSQYNSENVSSHLHALLLHYLLQRTTPIQLKSHVHGYEFRRDRIQTKYDHQFPPLFRYNYIHFHAIFLQNDCLNILFE
jgi:hypothetical protein